MSSGTDPDRHRDERANCADAAARDAQHWADVAETWLKMARATRTLRWGDGTTWPFTNPGARGLVDGIAKQAHALRVDAQGLIDGPTDLGIRLLLHDALALVSALKFVTGPVPDVEPIRGPLKPEVARRARVLVKAGKQVRHAKHAQARAYLPEHRRARRRRQRRRAHCSRGRATRAGPGDDSDPPPHGPGQRSWRFRAVRPRRRWCS